MADDLDLARMLQEGVSTGDILKELPPAKPGRLPGKGESLERARDKILDAVDEDMVRKAAWPPWGESQQRPLPPGLNWLFPNARVAFPAKESKTADFGRALLTGLMGVRGGMGSHGGLNRPFGALASELESEPSRLHVEGGLGWGEMPWSPGAIQPDRILGRTVAAPLALTKRDTSVLSDSDLADKIYDKVHVNEYPLRAQWAKIIDDFRKRPVYHTVESLKQGPMAYGYGVGASEGAAALGLLKYLPLLARAEEAPIPGSILDRPAYSRFARPGER